MYQVTSPWKLILGSASPRRKRMLQQIGLDFEIKAIDCDEQLNLQRSLPREAQRLALMKSLAYGPLQPNECLLTADTLVGIDGKILGKPENSAQAEAMISQLAGRTHQVASGYCLQVMANGNEHPWLESGYQLTQVTFRHLSQPEIKAYVASGESLDKAGAYGIQKKGAALVESIEGSFHNVVGLPLARVVEKLLTYNVISPLQAR